MRNVMSNDTMVQLAVNTIRPLDRPQQANSGHPGTPMALRPGLVTPDAAVVDAASHDDGVDTDYGSRHPSVSLDDIRRFRQIDSRAPGHPEYR
jgi:transketolase